MKVSNVYGSGRSAINQQAAGVFSGGARFDENIAAYMAQQQLRKKIADKPLKKSTRVVMPKKSLTKPKTEMLDEESLRLLFVWPSGVYYPEVNGAPLGSARNYIMHLRKCLDGTRLDRIEISRSFRPVNFGCFQEFLISSDCDDFHIEDVKGNCVSESWGLDDEWTLESRVTYWPDVDVVTKRRELVWVRFVFCADFVQRVKDKREMSAPFEVVFTQSPWPTQKEIDLWRNSGYPLASAFCPQNCVVSGFGIKPTEARIKWMMSAKTEELKLRRIVAAARDLALEVSYRMMTYPGAVRRGGI